MNTQDISIPPEITTKWQGIVNLIAEIISVPSALIMKVEPPEITVFISSESEDNTYERGEKAALNTGLYCETVMDTRERLLVPNALADDEWKSNPDIKMGMISYLGFPISWPTGDIFGTICVLDCKENAYNDLYQKFMIQCRDVVESDLKNLFDFNIRLEQEEQIKEKLKRASEESHRLWDKGERSRLALLSILEDEKRTKKALHEAHELLQITHNTLIDAIISTDMNYNIVSCNKAVQNIFGYTTDELAGRNYSILLSKEMLEDPNQQTRQKELFKKGYLVTEDFYFKRKNGEIFPASFSVALIRDSQGNPTGLVGSVHDITERKQAEIALRESEAFLNGVLTSIQDGISVLNPDLTVWYVNDVMKEWYSENLPLEGKKCFQCYHNTSQPCDPCPSLRCMESGKTESDIVPGLPGSTVEWIELYSYPAKDATTGAVTGIVEFVRDITERRQAEEELKEKMQQLDRTNKLMVGRELKMIELKKEINTLLEESGRPKKYTAPDEIQ